jgi:hypothetical protein
MDCTSTMREACGSNNRVYGVPLCTPCYFGGLSSDDFPCNDCSGRLRTSKCHFAPKKLGGY